MAVRTVVDVPVPPSTESEHRELSAIGLLAVLTAVLLPILAFFSVSVALGPIGSDLGASPGELQLVIAGFGVPYASLVVLSGRIGDGFGRRRLLVIGLVGFVATSVVCAVAQDPEQLIVARVLQGVAAAFTMPQVLATIHATTTGERRARAVGLFGATAGIGSCLGLLLGGAVTSWDLAGQGWRGVFWVNVPLGVLVIAAVLRWVPPTSGPSRVRIDLRGTVLLAVAMSLLVGALTEGRAVGWPIWIWAMLASFVPVGAAFVWSQLRTERAGGLPLVPPTLVRLRTVAVGLAIAAPFFAGFGGFVFLYPYAAQAGAHMSPMRIGVSMTALALAFFVSSVYGPRLVQRYGTAVLTGGAAVAAAGYGIVAVPVAASWPHFGIVDTLPGMLVVGLGQGLLMPPLFGLVLSQVPIARGGLGSGVLITTQQMMLGVGAAVYGSLYLTLADAYGGADAFAASVLVIAAGMAGIAALTRLLTPRS